MLRIVTSSRIETVPDIIETKAGSLGSAILSGQPLRHGAFAGKVCKGRKDRPCITRLNMYNASGYCSLCQPNR